MLAHLRQDARATDQHCVKESVLQRTVPPRDKDSEIHIDGGQMRERRETDGVLFSSRPLRIGRVIAVLPFEVRPPFLHLLPANQFNFAFVALACYIADLHLQQFVDDWR